MPTTFLGLEHLVCMHHVSSHMGWKHAWPKLGGMSRKRKRQTKVDIEAIRVEITQDLKEEFTQQVTGKVTSDLTTMLVTHGVNLIPLEPLVSPTFR